MNEQQTTIKEPENDPTGTETNERAQSGRTTMKKVVYYLVSPSNECATTFENGLRFNNGKLYHI